MIHRAVYGSLERFMAVLCEHYAGKWPFWVSPRQAIVIPISENFKDYAKKVQKLCNDNKITCDIDFSDNTINKKVRSAQVAQFNYFLVVGKTEMDNNSVNLRIRDQEKPVGTKTLDELIQFFKDLKKNYQ
jgi:threonyl-tRNA synthetase